MKNRAYHGIDPSHGSNQGEASAKSQKEYENSKIRLFEFIKDPRIQMFKRKGRMIPPRLIPVVT